MQLATECKKAVDLLNALALALRQRRRDRWPRQRLLQYQQARLRALVRWAVARSPFYRELYRGIDPATCRLQDLPVITKRMVMENFDRLVTDPALTDDGIARHLEDEGHPYYYLGRYVAFTTSGSTGYLAQFVCSRREWQAMLASDIRGLWLMGRRLVNMGRSAIIGEGTGHYIAGVRSAMPFGRAFGLHLAPGVNLQDACRALNGYQPRALIGYSTLLALLAHEQLAGGLQIRPRFVMAGAETLTPEARAQVQRAWDIQPFVHYGSTEGITACECAFHQGAHLLEDLGIIEVVDAEGRPVPPGTPGHSLLYTNLVRRTQPLIRYELSDMVTVTDEPCPCGRRSRRLLTIHGRTDEVLHLSGTSGGLVAVAPSALKDAFPGFPALREYQVVLRQEGLCIDMVLDPGGTSPTREIEQAVRAALANMGVAPLPIVVNVVAALPRPADRGGKLAVVRSEV